MSTVTFACVLRSGGIYTQEWVWALKRGLARHAPPHEFVCLTDMPGLGMWAAPLEHRFPGWFSKIELFRRGLFDGPVVYLDLDTLVVGDLSDIAGYRGQFAAVEDFYRGKGRLQSCVMAWTPSEATERIYHEFMRDPDAAMRAHRSGGDQTFIESVLPGYDPWQDLYPGQVVSLKVHCRPPKAQGPPADARLVCAHGRPKFSDPAAGWAHVQWSKVLA